MATNVETVQQEPTETKVKKFQQIESKSFKTYEEADSYRKSMTATDAEKIRVKFRRSRNEYDVVLFRR